MMVYVATSAFAAVALSLGIVLYEIVRRLQ